MDLVSLENVGDSHNFGRRVHFQPDIKSFLKPRPTQWEFFFLDPRSPFRKRIDPLLQSSLKLSCHDFLGSVEIDVKNMMLAHCKAVNVTAADSHARAARNFGRLIAFSTIFGLTDLHRANVLPGAEGLQVIDIESVFWGARTPIETNLLAPTLKAMYRTAFAILEPHYTEPISTEVFSEILFGFDEIIRFFETHLKSILTLLTESLSLQHQSLEKGFTSLPIRFIPRSTNQYRDFIFKPELQSAALPEELEQLQRKDIPYFFGFFGDANVYYFNEDLSFKAVGESFHSKFQEKIKWAFQTPQMLLSNERLKDVNKHCLASLLKNLYPLCEKEIREENLSVFSDAENYYLSIRDSNLGVKKNPMK